MDVDSKALLTAIERIDRHEEGSSLLLLALLGMRYRWGDQPHFPQEIRQPLEACILRYPYAPDEPGHDTVNSAEGVFTGEGNALLCHTCELLAGQLYNKRTFADQQTGEWHRARGERLAKAWMTTFGAYGMADWNSPTTIEQIVAALVHLCDLAENEQVYEIATVSLDKLLFALALHSFHGVLGVAGRSVGASFVKSGLLQPTAPISRLMWGTGIYNHDGIRSAPMAGAAGVVSLACSTTYQMPLLIETIALDTPADLWSREQHAHPHQPAANIVTYKTPDSMLSSVQDYQPGRPGWQEQVWQATLGAEAIVFTNHPGCSSESDSRTPGYWCGNARLPRVAQWKDLLVSIHRLEIDDLLAFTHAYFPTATFDDYVLHPSAPRGHAADWNSEAWAFARRGDGYLAITNSQGLTMPMQGRYAKRELRAKGLSQIWLVQMGRAALDGDFARFQAKVLAMPLSFAGGTVRCTSLRGDTLDFSWEGPLIVNGESQPLDGFKHYENLYTTTDLPCHQMTIQAGEDGLRLDFGI
jgi:hypothetical protein